MIAFKLRSADVPAIPQPAPLFEIYVYSPAMEGIHLRGGPVARGGIRWSDRLDYRTEVYGLMRAQLTKNAVIVPAGREGRLLPQAPRRPGRDELKAEVERQYVRYIGGLLELTDNLVEGEVVHPEGVRVLDDDDTYLVVAADKGTATFSDTANRGERGARLLARRRVRLGRLDRLRPQGARHHRARRLGVGQAPLLRARPRPRDRPVHGRRHRRHVRRRVRQRDAAVGPHPARRRLRPPPRVHRPDPDPDVGFAERKRLFELPGSTWDDYDRAKISEGGGVWPRTAKSIPLSPQARAALGDRGRAAAAERRDPRDPARAGRPAVERRHRHGRQGVRRDRRRRDGPRVRRDPRRRRDLRCRVVGEGGNLGFTRRARVEYAARGRPRQRRLHRQLGRRRLLRPRGQPEDPARARRAARRARPPARDELLREVTDDVVAHVLYDSFLQAQILAQEVVVSQGAHVRLRGPDGRARGDGLLDRAAEELPTGEEIAERRRAGRGLERPELALLLAYAKRALARDLLDSDFCDDPWLERDLRDYFPDRVVERFGHLLAEHPLRRELIAMVNANQVVNSLGPTFVSQLVAERGAEPADVVRAYRIAREVTGAGARWDAVEALGRDVDRRGRDGADGRRRPARRGGHPLVPRPRRRPPGSRTGSPPPRRRSRG